MKAMKKTYIGIAVVLSSLLLASGCGKWTDIEPKGTNMLQKVSDLDMLFNYKFTGMAFSLERTACVVTGDLYPGMTNVYELITQPEVGPVRSALYMWDETIDRKVATETDDTYTTLYGVIGQICNPVLMRADEASGDRAMGDRLKAEAYVLRAWFHYILVNLYAKAYDPATAAEDGGIPYSRETDPITVPNAKYTVQQVYDFIMEDLDAAFELNSLASPGKNRMRVNSAFAHAVKAKVLMSMRDYDGAYQAAAASLAIENTVDDHNTKLIYEASRYDYKTGVSGPGYSFTRPEMSSSEDLFYASYVYLLFIGISPEMGASFEPGNIFFNHVNKSSGRGYWGMNIDMLFDQDVYLNPGGLSTVDMYLVQAECLIRKGDAASIQSAMDIINMIRRHRVATEVYAATTAANDTADKIDPADFYSPLSAATTAEAQVYLKQMVHAENWYGPKRYINMKRWNTETDWKETLTKHVECVFDDDGDGTVDRSEEFNYSLSPESTIWIFPFPSKSTGLNANITQNY